MQAIYSDTSIRPHYVTIAKNGKVCCSDCPSWKARNLCAHSLAAAEKLGMTAKFIKWFKTNGLKQINLGALVTCDGAKGVGKKGKKATAVRKGGRNARKTPPTVVVDRISFRAEPHPQNAFASLSMPAMFEAQHSSNQVPVPTYQCQLPNFAQPRLSHPSQVSTYPPVPPATEFYVKPHLKRSATYQEEFLFINHLFPSILHHQIQKVSPSVSYSSATRRFVCVLVVPSR